MERGEERENAEIMTESNEGENYDAGWCTEHGQNKTRGNVVRMGKEMRLANTLDDRRYEYTRDRRWRMGGGRVRNDTSKQCPC